MTILTQIDGDTAFKLHQQIKSNELQRRELLAINSELLSKIKKNELYRAILGDDKAPWSAYLGQIEVMYSRHDVYNMIRIQQKYCEELGLKYETIADIPKSRLAIIIGIVTKDNVQDWLNKARVLTNQDFKDEFREAKGLPTTETCTHKLEEYEICSICGFKHKKENCETRKPISN